VGVGPILALAEGVPESLADESLPLAAEQVLANSTN
jgi:hypothetical protein